MHAPFSIEDAIRFGWEKLKEHVGLLFQVLLAYGAFEIVHGVIHNQFKDTPFSLPIELAISVVGIILSIGIVYIFLKLGQGKKAGLEDLIPPFELVWRAFLASLLMGIVVIGGFILLVIPGIYFLVRLSMARFLVLDGAPVLESLTKSGQITRGHIWQLLGFFIVCLALNVLGLLLVGVGLLVSVPVTVFASVYVYEKLKSHAHGHHHA